MSAIDTFGRKSSIYLLILSVGLMVKLTGSLVWAASSVTAWGANYFPDIELITQDGNKVRFYDDLIKGKVFAVNFIYTNCGDSCPLETAALRKVQNTLGEQMGKSVFFYSISIDGNRDKPSELKAYAEKFKAGPGWIFLTGSPEDVALLRQKLGLYRDDGKKEKALNEHNINILMGNERAGQWIKRSPYEETQALVRILGTRLQSGKFVKTTASNKIDRVLSQSPGEDLFRSKCEVCHSIGKDDDVGPGLQGITKRRDRAWLARWIKAPDKMLAARDQIAIDLFNRYNKIIMPNLRLTDADVDALINYLDAANQQSNTKK